MCTLQLNIHKLFIKVIQKIGNINQNVTMTNCRCHLDKRMLDPTSRHTNGSIKFCAETFIKPPAEIHGGVTAHAQLTLPLGCPLICRLLAKKNCPPSYIVFLSSHHIHSVCDTNLCPSMWCHMIDIVSIMFIGNITKMPLNILNSEYHIVFIGNELSLRR